MQAVSLVRIETEWHVFSDTRTAYAFYQEWAQYRDCEFIGEIPVDADLPEARLEYLRSQIEAERISYSEIVELQGLADKIEPGDVQLLEWAGVPEHPEDENDAGGITPDGLALGHRYVMGNVNAYCPQCTKEHSEAEGRSITVLDCDYDLDK